MPDKITQSTARLGQLVAEVMKETDPVKYDQLPRAAARTERRTSRVRQAPEGNASWSVRGGRTTTRLAHRNVVFGHPPACGRARGGVPSSRRIVVYILIF